MKFIKKLSNLPSLLVSLICAFVLLSAFSTNTYAAQSDNNPALFTLTNASTSSNPVQLYYANSYYDSNNTNHADGYIAIKNLAYTKTVIVHYSLDNSSTWNDIAASYYKTNTDGYEVWHFKTPAISCKNMKFAIKYVVNGQTYWDNNNANNYSLDAGNACFGKSFVAVKNASTYSVQSANNKEVSGAIVAKNVGNPKVIKIRYSTNNWSTYNEVNPYYLSDLGDNTYSYFVFYIPKDAVAQYAICYSVNGIEYWDNNFSQNYSSNNVIPN
jgi:hypothetical protein